MSIKDITDEINRIAQTEVKRINTETDEEIKKLQNRHNKVITDKKSLIEKNVQKKADELRRGIITREKLKMRSRVLEEKQSIVAELFEKLGESILDMQEKDYIEFYSQILKDSDIPNEKYELICAEGEKKISDNSVKELSDKTGIKMESSNEKIKGKKAGFIIKADYLELDFTLESVLENIRLEKEPDVVKILFE
ncbi:MAG: hypothetical protein C0601_01055 [Candidatus Muiribacterium halophilum]|uniref:V-type proton ATPase subunit E n=1 Tax=Muiribacterium halophilum TaxID=2053465 RepID=A0A2N5ZMD0_MUIH1|nr:MAG: hypothetical protein C0601_01055 [Candidatus Muirbacterium halophilum]